MTHSSKWGWRGALMVVVIALGTSVGVSAAPPELKGKFEVLKEEKSTHQPGKVKLIEFADFYCPHCHRFDGEGVALLKKEFGDKIEVTMVGFPVFQG
ncbi:MAG: disulfide bond formation protein DsbA, partial [Nitrospirota bacterium]